MASNVYKFFGSCGAQAEISNDGTTAQRKNPQKEFNNAVLIGNEPLVDDVLFQVRIDKKVTGWTGSIIVGVTATVPEQFKFPTTVEALAGGCWALQGTSVLKDGKHLITEYTQLSTETLEEGDLVGTMRRGGALHFFVNGRDLGAVEKKLPGKVYPVVDLYGRCAKVTIIQPNQDSVTASCTSSKGVLSAPEQLLFHTRVGTNIELTGGGLGAQRKNASGEFNNAIVMTNRPLKHCELFEVQLKKALNRWAGSIQIGLTTHNPATLTFPSTLNNLSTGTWVVSGSSVIVNGDIVTENIGKSLDQLQEGDYIGVMRNHNATMGLYVNGKELCVACSDIPPGVYGIADLYGRCVEVSMANRTLDHTSGKTKGKSNQSVGDGGDGGGGGGDGVGGGGGAVSVNQSNAVQNDCRRNCNGASDVCQPTGNTRTENPRTVGQCVEGGGREAGNHRAPVQADSFVETREKTRPVSESSLKFHARCGINVELSEDMTQATRKSHNLAPSGATLFTHRPLRSGEWFEIIVSNCVGCWNGSLRIGVCSTSPDSVTFTPVTESVNIDRSWVLCGHRLYHDGTHSEAHCNLSEISRGSKVGVMVTNNGDLHCSVNGHDFGCVAKNVPHSVYGVLDIYGQCVQVVISGYHHVVATEDHMTSASSHPIGDVTVVSSTPNAPIKGPLHSKCGANVQLTECATAASRLHSYKDGVVFSSHPLTVDKMFKVEITKLMSNWKGFFRIGLTTCIPNSLSVIPSTSTSLPNHTWIVNGSTVTENGSTLTETYGAALCRIQVKDIVGIQLHSDHTLHVYLNGEDLGVAASVHEISEDLYAVVDLYGPIAGVRVIEAQPPTPQITQPIAKNDEVITFAPTHSENIRLELGGRTACRFKSYSKGLVVTSAFLPRDMLFQVEITEMNSSWNGALSIGVTALPPSQVISAINAKQLPGLSFVVATNGDKSTALFVGGQEMAHLSADVNLCALKVGDSVGLLCKSSGALHFFLNGLHKAKLSCTVPNSVYGLVDLYGPCVKVNLKPLTPWSEETSSVDQQNTKDTHPCIQTPVSGQATPVSGQTTPFSGQATPFSGQATPVSGQATPVSGQATPFSGQATPFSSQATPFSGQATPFSSQATPFSGQAIPASGQATSGSAHQLNKGLPLTNSVAPPVNLSIPRDLLPAGVCSYQDLCSTLLRDILMLPDSYFAETGDKTRCLCKDCCAKGVMREPPVSSAGDPKRRYTLPLGWVEYNLVLPPRARSLNVQEKWNVAYHGTAVPNVRSILDCGGLLLPGDRVLKGDEVRQPQGHYTEDYKPSNFDVKRIFVTPSARYCSLDEVYTKPSIHEIIGKKYTVKVMFGVLINPDSFEIGAQTVCPQNQQIDEYFDNSVLEWSTKSHVSVILHRLYVKLDQCTR